MKLFVGFYLLHGTATSGSSFMLAIAYLRVGNSITKQDQPATEVRNVGRIQSPNQTLIQVRMSQVWVQIQVQVRSCGLNPNSRPTLSPCPTLVAKCEWKFDKNFWDTVPLRSRFIPLLFRLSRLLSPLFTILVLPQLLLHSFRQDFGSEG